MGGLIGAIVLLAFLMPALGLVNHFLCVYLKRRG